MLNQIMLVLLCVVVGLLGQDTLKWIINNYKFHKALRTGVNLYELDITKFPFKKWLIIGGILIILFGGVYGYGWWQGKKNQPVHVNLSSETEFTIPSPDGKIAIHKAKFSDKLEWINLNTGNVISYVKVKDIKELAKVLRPFGFKIEPIAVVGGSLGTSGNKAEGGIGLAWYKIYRVNLNTLLTSAGFYPLGVSYSITLNSGVGVAGGIGYKGDKRVLGFYYWRF